MPSPAPPPPASAPVLNSIVPSSIESGIDTAFDDPNLYAHPPGTPKSELFVMLPGSGAAPSPYRLLVSEAAVQGYHAIGLMYPNGGTVASKCQGSIDPACFGYVRNEIVTGEDTSDQVSVTPADSITGRLTAMLAYLATAEPSQGWDQFLVNGKPVWSKIVVGGSSQGGGHAMYIAKIEPLAGACAFDSPSDGVPSTGQPASWLSMPGVTPSDRLFGFTNFNDTTVSYGFAIAAWKLLGIPGAPTSVDDAAPPYGGSHQLFTTSPAGTADTHGYTSVNAATPMVDGVPLFAPVWDTVCFSR